MIKQLALAVLLLFALLMIAFDVGSAVVVVASPAVIHVPDEYEKIQEAVNAANPGDIISVSAGTYYEQVTVNKTLLLIGDDPGTTIIDGNRAGIVLYVTANNVKISGFTIQNGGGWSPYPGYGIVLGLCNGNTIYANTITSNVFGGILLSNSSGNMIINNQILSNGDGVPSLMYGEGITLSYSNGNIIGNNLISNNVVLGIAFSSSNENIVNNNTFTNNSDAVGIGSSAGNFVSDNLMTLNGNGVSVEGSTGNTIERNQIFKNDIGIGIGRSEMNVIKGNNIAENAIHGIAIAETSTNITVVGNTISNNLNGIKIHYSNGSIIHHNNFMNNTENAPEDVYPNVNTWDDGYPSGGNYWSDYNGTDAYSSLYQNITGSDGIGDTAHTLYAHNEDRFPLMGPINLFNVGAWNRTSCDVHVISNSTISNFRLNKTLRIVSFNVAGPDYTVGFCRVTIPNIIVQDLWQNMCTVLVDGNLPLMTINWTDSTYTYMYFTYLHSEHEVVIIPEFLAVVILLLFTIVTLCTVISRMRKTKL